MTNIEKGKMIEAIPENWRQVYKFLSEQLLPICPNKNYILNLLISSEELFTNIAKYAYTPNTGPVEIYFEFDKSNFCVKITFTDQGVPFNPTLFKNFDIKKPFKDRKIGGLGIFIVENMVDKFEYKFFNKKNICTISKVIQKEE